jgi:hypothetical protein
MTNVANMINKIDFFTLALLFVWFALLWVSDSTLDVTIP